MKFRSLLIGALVALLVPATLAVADTITSGGSFSLALSPSETVYSNNCGLSYSVCSESISSQNFPSTPFGFTIPGVSLPAGSTIESATLSFSFVTTAWGGSFTTDYLSPVDPYYTYSCGFWGDSTCRGNNPYSAPTYGVTGVEYGDFKSITSPHNSGSISNLSIGNVNLLSLGFGPDLLAGDGLTLYGIADSYLNFNYTYSGYNSISTTSLYSSIIAHPDATLDIQYSYSKTPEPASLLLLGTGLLGLGWVVRRIKPISITRG